MPTQAIAVNDLRGLARRTLVQAGARPDAAAGVVEVLLRADLFGIHTHGVQRIPQYLERVRQGGVDLHADVSVERVAPAVARVDGDNGVGPLVGARAMQAALDGARDTGVGVALARGSNHFGPVMPYLYAAAEQGFAAVVASNATTTIAPWGGKQTKIGNNPLGWGVPGGDGDPIMLDIALSVVARAKIRAAAARGDDIPDTWATDADGIATTDPAEALRGFLQPIAGHKGYGLSVMVDLFAGVLSGASYLDRINSWTTHPDRPQDLGHFFLVVDTAVLGSPAELSARVQDFRSRLLDTPAADPTHPVRLPGQLEMEAMHRQSIDGVDIEIADIEALKKLGADA